MVVIRQEARGWPWARGLLPSLLLLRWMGQKGSGLLSISGAVAQDPGLCLFGFAGTCMSIHCA